MKKEAKTKSKIDHKFSKTRSGKRMVNERYEEILINNLKSQKQQETKIKEEIENGKNLQEMIRQA